MVFEETPLAGAVVVHIEPHRDDRGFFARAYCDDEFRAHGLPTFWPQCNLSYNARKATLRGMHYQAAPHGEDKLVRCIRGGIYDVIVDLRQGSATYGQHFGVELTADNRDMLYIPRDFAHGFVTLEDDTEVFYHMGARFNASSARGYRWDDPAFKIAWPLAPAVISERDATYPDFEGTQ